MFTFDGVPGRLPEPSGMMYIQITNNNDEPPSLAAINEDIDINNGGSNLSRIADHVVDGVLAKLTHDVRLISPYPASVKTLTYKAFNLVLYSMASITAFVTSNRF